VIICAGVTTNAIILCAYAIGNAAGPFMWLKKYQPRNHIPWAILSACSFACAILILALRFMLVAENKRRDAEPYDDKYDNIYIIDTDPDGKVTEKKVDKVYNFDAQQSLPQADHIASQAFLDITDKQNREFRYVL